jgi:two-component system phosphate regulon sensor histidine kinase PhoR
VEAARNESNRLAAELASRTLEWQAVADTIDLSLLVCGAGGSIRFANRAAKQLFNFENPERRTILALSLSYGLQEFVESAFQSRTRLSTDISLSYPETRFVRAVAWRPEGSESVYLTLDDRTELRRLETVRTDFVANVSHELRTPLATIRATAETVHDDPHMPVAKLQRLLSTVLYEVDRLTNISADLLALTTAESTPPQTTFLNISEVVRYAVEHAETDAAERGLRLQMSGDDQLYVSGDRYRLMQVFTNLLSNALRYTPQGDVTVTCRSEGGEAVIEVRDTGIGIASEHLPRIFERFYRVDRARSRETGGTGLGLSIVRHIVETHGGRIEVDSELNVGSTFRVRLPLAEPLDGAEQQDLAPEAAPE